MTHAPDGGQPAGSLFAGRPKTTSRRDTAFRRFCYRLAAPLLAGIAHVGWATWRVRVEGDEHALALVREGRAAVPCFWHRDLAAGMWAMRRLLRRGMKVGLLISPSFDGEVPAKVAARWGFRVVRGSATRTGARAMRDLLRAVRRENVSPAMVPDGPRGPELVLKPGAVMLAQLSGAALLPVALAARPAFKLPTWDRMRVPPPFARVVVMFGAPRDVDRDLPPDGLEAERVAAEKALKDLVERAEKALRA